MKKILIKTGLMALIMFIVGVATSFASTLTLPTGWSQATAQAYTNRYTKIETTQRQDRLQTLRKKIAAIIATTNDQNVKKLLTFIDSLASMDMQHIIDQDTSTQPVISKNPSTPTTTTPEKQTLSGFDTGSFDAHYAGSDLLVLAGTQKQILSKFEISAVREPIIIEDISLQASTELTNYVETFYLVSKDGTIHATSGPVIGRNTLFRGVDMTISQQATTEVYVVADLKRVGYNYQGAEGISFRYALNIDEAHGRYSDEPIQKSVGRSQQITLGSVAISDIRTVDSAYGYTTDTILTQGENTLMLFEIDVAASNNQQRTSPNNTELMLESLTLSVSDSTTGKTVLDTLTIERIDKQSNPISPTSTVGDDALFTTLPNKTAAIKPGTTATFIVRGNASLSSTGGESVQISLQNLNNGAITRKEETGTITYNKTTSNTASVYSNKVVE